MASAEMIRTIDTEKLTVATPYREPNESAASVRVIDTPTISEPIRLPYQSEIVWQAPKKSIEPTHRTLTHAQRYKLKEEGRSRVNTNRITSRDSIDPLRGRHVPEEQREANLSRVLSQSDRLISVSADRIQQALDVLTPAEEGTYPEVVNNIDDIPGPAMSKQEAVTTLSAWAHMGDRLRKTVRDSKYGTVVTFVRPNKPSGNNSVDAK